MAQSFSPAQIITRLVDGRVHAYDLAVDTTGVLAPVMTFRPVDGDDVVGHTAAADLRRAYYTTLHAVVCVTPEGTEVWRSTFEPRSEQRYGHRPSCALSTDGRTVWVYRPDAMAGRGPDRWVALDGGTGAVLAEAELETVGHGGEHLPHPAGDAVLLDVGEGQDGAAVHRATLTGDRLDLVRYPWSDRCLIALSPDGSGFMTVDHDQGDVSLHTYPDGEATLTLRVEAFGHDSDETFVEWSGGYLTQDSVVVTLVGETEDEEEWFRHYRVDLRSDGTPTPFDAHAENAYDLHPLGDGTWLTTSPSGHPSRWSDS
ncbi:MAG: hypothetical protein HOV70_02730 [Streptomyces sp.]|nr:hypothetical protein [Streptomyces sp.]NUS75103.1 hypothetical protein [Streptomyces sp.]